MRDLRPDGNMKGESQSSSGAASFDSLALQVPAISLPKSGGAIRGLGEKFTANPPGRAGFFGPKLALSYGSGADNGRCDMSAIATAGEEVVVFRMSAEPRRRGEADFG